MFNSSRRIAINIHDYQPIQLHRPVCRLLKNHKYSVFDDGKVCGRPRGPCPGGDDGGEGPPPRLPSVVDVIFIAPSSPVDIRLASATTWFVVAAVFMTSSPVDAAVATVTSAFATASVTISLS